VGVIDTFQVLYLTSNMLKTLINMLLSGPFIDIAGFVIATGTLLTPKKAATPFLQYPQHLGVSMVWITSIDSFSFYPFRRGKKGNNVV